MPIGATTYNTAGFRENITDDVFTLSPQDTPLISLSKRGKAKANYHEYHVNKLRKVNPEGAKEEDVATYNNQLENRAKIGNRVQKFVESWGVTKRAKLMDSAGPEIQAQSETDATQVLKNSMEARFCSDSEMVVGDDDNADEARGMGVWIQTAAQSVNPVDSRYRTPAASIDSTATGSVTISTIEDVMKSIFLKTGSPSTSFLFLAGAAFKSKFSKLARTESSSLLRTQMEVGKYKLSVESWSTDFGDIRIIPTVWNALVGPDYDNSTAASQGRCYIIRPDLLSIDFADGITSYDTTAGQDSPRGYVEAYATLSVGNPLGFGKFAPTSLT